MFRLKSQKVEPRAPSPEAKESGSPNIPSFEESVNALPLEPRVRMQTKALKFVEPIRNVHVYLHQLAIYESRYLERLALDHRLAPGFLIVLEAAVAIVERYEEYSAEIGNITKDFIRICVDESEQSEGSEEGRVSEEECFAIADFILRLFEIEPMADSCRRQIASAFFSKRLLLTQLQQLPDGFNTQEGLILMSAFQSPDVSMDHLVDTFLLFPQFQADFQACSLYCETMRESVIYKPDEILGLFFELAQCIPEEIRLAMTVGDDNDAEEVLSFNKLLRITAESCQCLAALNAFYIACRVPCASDIEGLNHWLEFWRMLSQQSSETLYFFTYAKSEDCSCDFLSIVSALPDDMKMKTAKLLPYLANASELFSSDLPTTPAFLEDVDLILRKVQSSGRCDFSVKEIRPSLLGRFSAALSRYLSQREPERHVRFAGLPPKIIRSHGEAEDADECAGDVGGYGDLGYATDTGGRNDL